MTTSWLAGRDETFWNTGRRLSHGRAEYPLDSFWSERFIKYPDDLTSGPIRKPEHGLAKHSSLCPTVGHPTVVGSGGLDKSKRSREDDRRATVVTRGLSNHFFPFGGGTSMCPGRNLAKNEVITALAVILRTFEIELVNPQDAGITGSKMTSFPFLSLRFDRKVPVRIKRRSLN